jgi:probable rRNA maturation factor
MAVMIELQNDDGIPGVPDEHRFQAWVEAALQADYDRLEQTIRVVDRDEGLALNKRYRGKDAATNVLAFPYDGAELGYDCLGDLVLCAPVVAAEAAQQGKTEDAHFAHLVVHGMLHLQGFDHQRDAERDLMEALEVKILDRLGYTNPYND